MRRNLRRPLGQTPVFRQNSLDVRIPSGSLALVLHRITLDASAARAVWLLWERLTNRHWPEPYWKVGTSPAPTEERGTHEQRSHLGRGEPSLGGAGKRRRGV